MSSWCGCAGYVRGSHGRVGFSPLLRLQLIYISSQLYMFFCSYDFLYNFNTMASSKSSDKPLYEPLHTIRLLRLLWGKGKTDFDGILDSFALNSASCPPYVAVSYVWGNPPSCSKSINLNGHKFNVLDSLYPFLRLAPNLPGFSADTWWWIDSICINQEVENEKSSQMEIMGTIYQRARKTVV